MKEIPQPDSAAPIWARPDAFPIARDGWGWLSPKGVAHPCDSHAALVAAIAEDRNADVELVWEPRCPRMILPEELADAGNAILTARTHWSRADTEESARKLRWFGLILLACGGYVFFGNFLIAGSQRASMGERLLHASKATLNSTQTGLCLLVFVIFGFIPWYQARKQRLELSRWSEERLANHAPSIRFETWLARENAPVTKVLLGLMAVVGAAQIFGNWNTRGWASLASLFQGWDGVAAAGLQKEAYRSGEWWRILTAPFLHGNVVHFLMNASGLAYLGKRLEVFARWPHLPMVFLFSAWAGGLASVYYVSAPTLGASGGLMGWLGFLLVFETLHKPLVPLRARRRLAAGILLTAFIGLVEYRYVDNAAHAGGLLAGMLYAGIVFPRSVSMHRPKSTLTDRLAGTTAIIVLVAAAVFAMSRLIAH